MSRLGEITFPCLMFCKDRVTSGDEGMYLYWYSVLILISERCSGLRATWGKSCDGAVALAAVLASVKGDAPICLPNIRFAIRPRHDLGSVLFYLKEQYV